MIVDYLKKGTQSGATNVCIKENGKFVFDHAAISNDFKAFFSDIAKIFLPSYLPLQRDSTKSQYQNSTKDLI